MSHDEHSNDCRSLEGQGNEVWDYGEGGPWARLDKMWGRKLGLKSSAGVASTHDQFSKMAGPKVT
jgi:hypothetical protein